MVMEAQVVWRGELRSGIDGYVRVSNREMLGFRTPMSGKEKPVFGVRLKKKDLLRKTLRLAAKTFSGLPPLEYDQKRKPKIWS